MAADIVVDETGALIIVGRIEAGDGEKFRRTVISEIRKRTHDNPVRTLHIYSPGGDLSAALDIGEQVHRLQLKTRAPTVQKRNTYFPDKQRLETSPPHIGPRWCDLPGERERRRAVFEEHRRHVEATTKRWKQKDYSPLAFEGQLETFDSQTQRGDARCDCASACFFIWAAGAERSGDVVGIHRPSFSSADFANLSASEARDKYRSLEEASKSYLANVGIPQELVQLVFATSSTKIAYLSQQDLKRLRLAPHLEELLIAKCGGVTTPDDITAMSSEEKAVLLKFMSVATGPRPVPKEFTGRVRRYLETLWCEGRSLREVYRQTNLEYLSTQGQ
jgi:hypothetical protein